MGANITTAHLVQQFRLEVLAGESGLTRKITVIDLFRPGLIIAGHYDYYPAERIQILGKTELDFFDSLPVEQKRERMQMLCQSETPCICISRGMDVPSELLEEAEKAQLPILRSKVTTTALASRITGFLENILAQKTTVHGVLVEIYGIGVLLTGSSGIGKSETALELVKRGHRLVADDAVEIRQTEDHMLFGTAPDLIKHLLEIRGVGIINVMTLFGAGAIRNFKKISLVVRLETWQQDREYDRLGIDEQMIRIIDTELPQVIIPVRPGRNLAVIIEVAAMNYRLKRMGYNAAVQFTNKLTESLAGELDDFD